MTTRVVTGWLPNLIGPLDLQADGTTITPRRAALNFVGGTVVDNPDTGATDITVAGTGATWSTVLDLDFTAEATQSIATDTTYTIGGLTWTKVNSAADRVAMAITNGAGLVVKPVSGANRYDQDRNCPLLELRLGAIIEDFDALEDAVRLWVHVASDNATVRYDNVVTAIDDGTNKYAYAHNRGYAAGSANPGLAHYIEVNGTVLGNPPGQALALADSNRVMMLEVKPIWGAMRTVTAHGAWAAGWPAVSALTKHSMAALGQAAEVRVDQSAAIADDTLWRLALGAMTYSSGTTFTATIAHVRVDVKRV